MSAEPKAIENKEKPLVCCVHRQALERGQKAVEITVQSKAPGGNVKSTVVVCMDCMAAITNTGLQIVRSGEDPKFAEMCGFQPSPKIVTRDKRIIKPD